MAPTGDDTVARSREIGEVVLEKTACRRRAPVGPVHILRTIRRKAGHPACEPGHPHPAPA